MKKIKILVLLLVIFILIGCNNEWILNGEQYKGKKLGIIVKTNNRLNNKSGIDLEGFGEKLNNEEIKKISNFFEKKLNKYTDMIIINKQNILDNKEAYHQKSIQDSLKSKYNLDFLLVVNLSKITFNVNRQTTRLSVGSDWTSELNETSSSSIEERAYYEYGCSVKVSYQVIDLSKDKAIYSKEESAYYKTDTNYKANNSYEDRIELLKEAIDKEIGFKI